MNTLGAFLRSRRNSVTPEQAGLRSFGQPRRVPGLRREELAQLAGVSISYYTRLEQDQAGTASNQVLDSLTRVLGMDDTERAHLHNLAARPKATSMKRPRSEQAHPRVLALLDTLSEATPALVLGRRNDVLAWNTAGHALLAPHVPFDAPADPQRRPSMTKLFFLDPHTRDLHRNWDEQASTPVAYLRLVAGRYPDDARLAGLIGELAIASPEFVELWSRGKVEDCTAGNKRLHHPTVGELAVDYQVWIQPDSPDNRLEVYTPATATSQDALRLLHAPDSTQADSEARRPLHCEENSDVACATDN
jgi:transcriptional regulator with XRE-family HTH domain